MSTYLTHAQAVLCDEVAGDAAVLVEDGHIAAINPLASGGAMEVDLAGAYLLPGLIDLHCDALEKEVEPRPNVRFPIHFAVAEIDKRNAVAGITTPYHALSFAGVELGMRSNSLSAEIVRAIRAYGEHGMVDNRTHCRYEITDADGQHVLAGLIEEGSVDLVSLMDHTPGQGQFKQVADFEEYLAGVYHKTEDEIQAIVERKFASQGKTAQRVAAVAAAGLARNLPLASHDDDSTKRLAWMRRLGITISEFPISLEVAKAAREMGLATMFGAPNLLRGLSQSGSMKASEAVTHEVVDLLCSDYAPATLLPAVFRIHEHYGWALPKATRLATANAARVAGLEDRGQLTPGRRADLIAVRLIDGLPQVMGTWCQGRAVLQRDGMIC